ncbi:MAG: DUF4838 domain-containing protein [Saprospiraceae bacterium]|nr:DUF4838 domain-containing protein [Saprospiraceae bacterium]
MKHLFLLLLLPAILQAQSPRLVLSTATTDESYLRAVYVLNHYLVQITGAPPETLRSDKKLRARPLIYVGPNPALKKYGLSVPAHLPDDAVYLQGRDNVFVVAGGGSNGPEYAACALLELLGCRRYSPVDSFIPRIPNLRLPDYPARLDTPAFPYRELWYQPATNVDWARWHRLKTRPEKKAEWGLFVHTFHTLCPAEMYFSEHPEYFSWNGAQYSPAQLCLSNDTVKQIVIESLRERMASNPGAQYWSVSQNDNYDYCRCARCAASDQRYGSPAGTLLAFVNDVAAAFPDKTISTLAYQYTRRAPRGIRPARNVSVCLCSIECNRGMPIAEGCPDFARDVAEWSALTDNLMIWDYVVQFRSYLSPFPNWHTLQPNLQLFQQHRVRMIFEQGSGSDRSELCDMRAYLLAKLMWNPQANVDSILNDFGQGYYGEAWPAVRAYVHELTENMLAGDKQLTIYNIPQNEPFLSFEYLPGYISSLNAGRERIKPDSVLENHLGEILVNVLFAMSENLKNDSIRLPQMMRDTANLAHTMKVFVEACDRVGFRNLHENGYSPQQYALDYMAYIRKTLAVSESRSGAVTLRHPASPTYAGGRAEELANRRIGETDYRFNWLGFQGQDMVATASVTGDSVRIVQVSFLQDQQSWVFFPEAVQIEISNDGVDFQTVHREQIVLQPDGKKAVRTVAVDLGATRPARFVRVTAMNAKVCPDWHGCNGNPCWIFADEIVVL